MNAHTDFFGLARFSLVGFDADHLDTVAPHLASPGYKGWLVGSTDSYTIIDADGPIACGGLYHIYEGRSVVWFSLNERGKSNVRVIVRLCRWALDTFSIRRIEAYVDPHDLIARRFVEFFGFKHEGMLEAVSENGEDKMIYSRIKR